MLAVARPSHAGSAIDNRRSARAALRLAGKLFINAGSHEEDCMVLDLSPEGAGVKCSAAAPPGMAVVLYVNGFGRFEGKIVQRNHLRIGIEFKSGAAKRARTAEMLKNFIATGTVCDTALREGIRSREAPPLRNFTDQNGRQEPCEIVDIALGGAHLKTSYRPPVGERVRLGVTSARVVRHTDEGIALEFLSQLPI